MTLGEKIKDARRKCGFSQEQLAEKLSVSRSAIAKWETDKGLPDVGNLKILARLLNVSVDYLLDETKTAEPVFRESYNPASYGYGCSKIRKDRVVRDKFPGATKKWKYPPTTRSIAERICRIGRGIRTKRFI